MQTNSMKGMNENRYVNSNLYVHNVHLSGFEIQRWQYLDSGNRICSCSWLPKAKQVVRSDAFLFLHSLLISFLVIEIKLNYAQFSKSECFITRLEEAPCQHLRHCSEQCEKQNRKKTIIPMKS